MVTTLEEEKDADLRKEITPKLRVRLERLIDSNPTNFMVSFCKYGPEVVMPDGRIYIRDPEYPLEFNDAVAETFANQNEGLYFPSSVNESFPISRFIEAIKRLIPNSREETKKLAENPEAFADLLEDSSYIQGEVYPKVSQWIRGFTGTLDPEKLNVEGVRHSFNIELALGGFGSHHFGVSERALSTELYPYRIKENSLEYNAIAEYITSKNNELRDRHQVTEPNLKLFLSFIELRGIRLELQSPGSYYSNKRLKIPVIKTREMAQYFSGIVREVDNAILRVKNMREERVEKERSNMASLMGLK